MLFVGAKIPIIRQRLGENGLVSSWRPTASRLRQIVVCWRFRVPTLFLVSRPLRYNSYRWNAFGRLSICHAVPSLREQHGGIWQAPYWSPAAGLVWRATKAIVGGSQPVPPWLAGNEEGKMSQMMVMTRLALRHLTTLRC